MRNILEEYRYTDIHGIVHTIYDVADKCKEYDSEYVDGATALSIEYIFGRLIPLIEESVKGEQT